MRQNIVFDFLLGSNLYDFDGNLYTTVDIGTQRWTVQNLSTTHYGDGTLIPNLVSNTSSNLITSWVNTDFSTFTSSGANITSAVEASGTYGHAASNSLTLTISDIISGNINVTLNSGTLGKLALLKNGATYSWIDLSTGVNTFGWSIPENNNYQLQLISSNVGTNMSATVVANSVYTNGWVDDVTGAYCYYNNVSTKKNPYGALYNWYAVHNAHGLAYFKRDGVQETGWRVPTKVDFDNLQSYGGVYAGSKLKEVGTAHWNSPNSDATDSYGFKGLPGGYRYGINGAFSDMGYRGYWFSQDTQNLTGNDLILQSDSSYSAYTNNSAKNGFSVKCVKDI